MPASLWEYRRARRAFFARHGARWPETLADEFDILAPWVLSQTEAEDVLDAAASLAQIYARAAQLLRCLSDENLLEMGVPPHLLHIARCEIPGMADCVIGRFDIARTEQGYKLLEFNADVPGFIVETFSVNTAVCRDAGKDDPNDGGEQELVRALTDAVQAGVRYVGKKIGEHANVVVTSRGDYRRDRALAEYLTRLLDAFHAQYVPMESLGIDAGGLYDPGEKRIDVLYRSFPLQLIRDELFHPREMPIEPEMGGILLRLVEQRRLAIINPPFSFLLQSKALQAVIWNLAQSKQFFTNDECRLIDRYMLPTYLDPPKGRAAYVIKPAYGAEGDTVKIVTSTGELIRQSPYTSHTDHLMVYQEYVDLMPSEMMTEYGPRTLYVITSCFLLSGNPCGIFMRAGEAITDELAWVLPVCISC